MANDPDDLDRLKAEAFAEVAQRITSVYREAEDAEGQLDAVLTSVPAIIWRWEPEGRCTYVNDAWTLVLGRDPAEALGDGWAQSVHPDDADLFRERCVAAMEQGTSFVAEYRLRCADGTYVTVNDQGRPMVGEEATGFVGAALDVSSQRSAQTRVRASNALFSAVAEGMGVGLGVKDLAGRYIIVNEVMARILNAPVDAVLGRTDGDLGGTGWERLVAEDRKIIATGVPLRAERHVRNGDEILTYLAHKSPLRAADGRIDGVIIVSADVTPENLRRRRAERLQHLARTLAGSRSTHEVADAALGPALEALQAPHGALGLPTDDGEGLAIERQHGFEAERDEGGRDLLDTLSPVASAFTEGRPRFYADAAALLAEFPGLTGNVLPYEARAALPLLGSDGPIGVLYAAFDRPTTFDAETIGFFTGVADLVARALERAVLFDAAERAAAETAVLQRITADLGGAVAMDDVMRVAALSARDAVRADACLLGTVDADTNTIRYETDAYPEELVPTLPTSLTPGDSPAGDAILSGRTFAFGSSDEILSTYPELRELLDRLPFASRLFVPIVGSGEPIGVMVASSRVPNRFGPDEVRLLEAIGRQCGQSLERATFYQDARTSAERTATLQVATTRLASALTTEEACDAIMEQGMAMLEASLGGLALLQRDAGVLRPVRWSGIPEELVRGLTDVPLDAATAGTDAVRAERSSFLSLNDLRAADPSGAARAEQLGVESFAVVPLVSGGTVVGVLGLGYPGPNIPSIGDRDLLEAFAERAAATLQRTHLLETEHRIRRELEGALTRLSKLQSVTTSLSMAVRLDEVAAVVLEATSGALGGAGGALFIGDGRVLRRLAVSGIAERSAYREVESVDIDTRISVCDAFRTGHVDLGPHPRGMGAALPGGRAVVRGTCGVGDRRSRSCSRTGCSARWPSCSRRKGASPRPSAGSRERWASRRPRRSSARDSTRPSGSGSSRRNACSASRPTSRRARRPRTSRRSSSRPGPRSSEPSAPWWSSPMRAARSRSWPRPGSPIAPWSRSARRRPTPSSPATRRSGPGSRRSCVRPRRSWPATPICAPMGIRPRRPGRRSRSSSRAGRSARSISATRRRRRSPPSRSASWPRWRARPRVP